MNIDLLVLNLPAIVMLGLATSYTDITQGKIRNRHCMLAIAYGIISLVVASILLHQQGITLNARYYLDVGLNVIVAIIISFIIWNTGLLTAGDMKLFLAYSILIPLSVYKYGYVQFFPASTILVNTFVPLFISIFLFMLFRTTWIEKREAIRSSLEPKRLGILAIATFGFSWIIGKAINLITFLPRDYFTMILMVFLVMVVCEKLLRVSFLKVCVILAVARVIFGFGELLTIEPYLTFLFLFCSLLLLRIFVLELSSKMFTKEIGLDELKEGMVIAEVSGATKENPGGAVKVYYDFVNYLMASKTKEDGVGGHSRQLTKEEVDRLKRKLKIQNVSKIRIHHTIPFAPFMFFGVILTLLLNGEAIGVANLLVRLALSTH
jgi:hypothetical protein